MLRLLLALLALTLPAAAQVSVVTGLSVDNIALNANFDGSEIFVSITNSSRSSSRF